MATAAFALLAFAPLAGAKEVSKFFGTQAGSGSFGGEFSFATGSGSGAVAANSSGEGAPQGTTYVADHNNHRVQRFDANERFVSAWGKDVIAATVNERQRLVVDATGGSYFLTVDGVTTAPIAFDASSSTVDNALDVLSSIGGDANVTVTTPGSLVLGSHGSATNPLIITFTGALAGTDLPQITADTSQLEGTLRITTLADGDPAVANDTGTGFEVCTVAAECKAGIPSGGDGAMADNGSLDNPEGIAVDQDSGNVYVADRDNRRVNVYDGSGNFIRSFGWEVVVPGETGDAPGTDEVQRVTIHNSATGGKFALRFGGQTTGGDGSGRRTSGSDTLTNVTTSSGAFAVGQVITGFGIPADTTIAAIDTGAGTITLSAAATTGTDTNTTLTGHDIPWDASAAQVQTALEGVRGLGAGNVTVASANPGGGVLGGPYDVTFTGFHGDRNVAQLTSSAVGLVATTRSVTVSTTTQGAAGGFEVCEGASASCRAGEAGAGAGQIGSTSTAGTLGLAITPPDGNPATGTVLLADSQNRRVNTYDLDGANPSSFGSATEFGTTQPRKIAVDSRGIVYASDSTNGNEVDRFDTENIHGGGLNSPLASIPSSTNEVQRVEFPPADSGLPVWLENETYRLTCPNGVQTDEILYNHNSSPGGERFAEALEAACGAGNVSVSGGPLNGMTVIFIGDFGSRDVGEITCTPVRTERGTCTVTTTTQGRASTLLAGDTRGLAVDPANDALYALRAAGSAAVQQFGPVNDPGALAAPAVADAAHGSAAGFNTGAVGLGLDEASGRLFVSDTSGSLSSAPGSGAAGAGHRVYVLEDPLPNPAVILNAVAAKTDATAGFSASVNPVGGLVRCAFELSTDPGFATPTEVAAPGCDSFGPDAGFQALRQTASGLQPNTKYFYRLRVTRTFDSSAVFTSEFKSFTTDSVPPGVSDVGAIQVSDTSARLVGTIDPKNSATGYVFQYGTTPAMNQSTAPVNIGGGNRPITVSQRVTGLAVDTEHFFRLVATNGFGTTNGATASFHTRAVPIPDQNSENCPNEAIRQAQGSTFLPDCMAYELVSPPDKNEGGVDQYFFGEYLAGFARSGDAAVFCTNALFGEPAGQMPALCAPYRSERSGEGPTGWSTAAPFPRYCVRDRAGFGGFNLQSIFNPDLDRALIGLPESSECLYGLLDPAAPDQNRNLYRQDFTADPFSFDLVAPRPIGISNVSVYLGGDEDFSHLFYHSVNNQTDPPDSPAPGSFGKIYEWVAQGESGCASAGGCVRLASVRPDGTPLTTDSSLATTVGPPTDLISSAISADGERIYFQSPATLGGGCVNDASCHVYLREGGASTIDVSASECTRDCSADASMDFFRWASPEGDIALFLSCDKLTDASAPGASCSGNSPDNQPNYKLYRWDRDGPIGGRLTDLSVDAEPGDGAQASVVEVLGASDNGEVGYFVARGQIVAGEPTGAAPVPAGLTHPSGGPLRGTQMKLYRWSLGGGVPRVEYLAPYLSYGLAGLTDQIFVNPSNIASAGHAIASSERIDSVSVDGRELMLSSPLALDPAVDRDSDVDVYRWDERGGWTCVSCQEPGAPSAGHANNVRVECCGFLDAEIKPHRNPSHDLSADGHSVVFTSRDALLPQDTNGEAGCPKIRGSNHSGVSFDCQDVYQWNDGRLSLISPGAAPEGAIMMGQTPSGDGVFFMTRERLVGWDTDNAVDIYVARVNGGFPEPPPAPPGCEGEACRGPATVDGGIGGAGSRAFEGAGNPPPRFPGASPACNRISKKAQRKLAAAKRATRKGQAKRARALRKQARNLNRRAKRCNRRNAS